MSFELLLTDLRTLDPAFDLPLDAAGVHRAPRPEQRAPTALSVPGHSNDLVRERWGVVVPDTPAGNERLAWIQPLGELRRRQCGLDELPILRVPPGARGPAARQWRARYESMHPQRRPGYLLLLGDLDEIPLEVQQELMVSASVGRLCFTTEEGQPDRAGYEAYSSKLCSAEAAQRDWNDPAQLLFYAARDGTQAVETGYLDLIRLCYRDARADQQLQAEGKLAVEDIRIFGSAADHQWHAQQEQARGSTLVHFAEMRQPAVLLSMTHGAGITDVVSQRLHQGALVLGEAAGQRRKEVLEHGYFSRRFLPSGFWFLKACFGAGTPTTSAYQRWLEELRRLGVCASDPRAVLEYLAPQRPFVARLPQVALAHPDGPLGVLGHVDLAWTFGYQSRSEVDGRVQAEHGPYYDVIRGVVSGSRFGPAVASLSEKLQALGTHLATLYRDSEPGRVDEAMLALRSWLWMRYSDLAGYILLGDPAAQVPTRAARDVATPAEPRSKSVLRKIGPQQAERPPSGPTTMPPDRLASMEQAVLAYIQRKQPSQLAKQAGVSVTTLEHWVHTYQEAGSRALSGLTSDGDQPGGKP
jgi:hypothetical protein